MVRRKTLRAGKQTDARVLDVTAPSETTPMPTP